jgi:hypothetical protein
MPWADRPALIDLFAYSKDFQHRHLYQRRLDIPDCRICHVFADQSLECVEEASTRGGVNDQGLPVLFVECAAQSNPLPQLHL